MSVTKSWGSSDELTIQLPISLRLEAIEGNITELLLYMSMFYIES